MVSEDFTRLVENQARSKEPGASAARRFGLLAVFGTLGTFYYLTPSGDVLVDHDDGVMRPVDATGREFAYIQAARRFPALSGSQPSRQPAGRESSAACGGWDYRSGVHIQFDVPADPAYPGRVAAVLSSVRLRKHGYAGAVLVAVGMVGLAVWWATDWGEEISPLSVTSVVGGLLLMLYPPWVRFKAQRRSSRYAVEGGYEITDDNIIMRSGTESGGIAWEGVARVVDTPDFWILFVGRMPATVIPRRFMSAEDDQALGAFMAKRGLLKV